MSRPLDFDAASDGSSSHLPIPAAGVLLSSEAVRALALGDLMADRYELLRELQSGIFLAYDRVAARNVRLVMFPPERAAAIKRISGMVVPTGLISIDDVQQTARGSFYTVELFDDTTLRADLVRRATTEHRFSVEEVRHLGEQLIEILEPLEKPATPLRLDIDTVLLRTDDRVCLSELSLIEPDTQDSQYQLAALLYELLAGTRPKPGCRPLDQIRSQVPRRLAQALQRGLTGQGSKQFRSLRAFGHALTLPTTGGVPIHEPLIPFDLPAPPVAHTGEIKAQAPDVIESHNLPRNHKYTPEEWLATVYQGDDAKQLTVRSVVTGMLIGGVMSISNLYVGLKTGWGLGVTITACIIAYAVFNILEKIIPAYRKDPFTILENYTMSSAASAAGYMASAGLVSAIPALYLVTGRQLAWWEMMSWLCAVSLLGVFMAIPLKRQLINEEGLPFPSGIATAETLRSMHSSGAEALGKARALFVSGLAGAFLAFWRDGFASLFGWLSGRLKMDSLKTFGEVAAFPSAFPLFPGAVGQNLLSRYTIGMEGSLIMLAAGAIMGIRVGISLLVGAFIYFAVIGYFLLEQEIVKPGYKGIVSWTLWPATGMMVASGLLSFAFRWRTVLKAFGGLSRIFGQSAGSLADPLDRVEVPGSWFLIGTLVSGTACVILGEMLFGIHWWMGVIAVLVTFLLSIVAARATGETDITPIGAMGKITQLLYAVITPRAIADQFITTNLMTASITAGAASHSADLLTDLKSGYLLGGNPRKQTLSQLFGVLAGTLVCVPVYCLIVKPEDLGTEKLPAPSAKVWQGVAEMLGGGIDKLPKGALTAMLIGVAIGIVLALLEEFIPKKHRHWIPSATGLGIAGVIPAFNSIAMFFGALVAWILAKTAPKTDENYTVAVSSGLIAGESLMAVTIMLWDVMLWPLMKSFWRGEHL